MCVAVLRTRPDGPVVTATWHHQVIGPPEDPRARRISGIVTGVHDPVPRHRGDAVADPSCALLGGRPCFWRRAEDNDGPVVAFVAYGRDALEEALEALLEDLA
jgi:hypothetical protein